MAEAVTLKVLTPIGTVIDTEADEVAIPGIAGEFGILPSHTPYLAALAYGLLTYSSGGLKKVLAIRGGVAEINNDDVVILTEETHFPEEIDPADLEAREKELKSDLEEAMDRGKPSGPILADLAFLELLRTMAGQDIPGTG